MNIPWKQQYVVAVTRGRTTKYYYGQKLKDAVSTARLKEGDEFAYAKFERGAVQRAEIGPGGRTYGYIGPMRKAG